LWFSVLPLAAQNPGVNRGNNLGTGGFGKESRAGPQKAPHEG